MRGLRNAIWLLDCLLKRVPSFFVLFGRQSFGVTLKDSQKFSCLRFSIHAQLKFNIVASDPKGFRSCPSAFWRPWMLIRCAVPASFPLLALRHHLPEPRRAHSLVSLRPQTPGSYICSCGTCDRF